MFEDQYSNYNGSEYNFTTPLNYSIENSNASRHFADEPNLSGVISFQGAFVSFFLLMVSIAVLSCVVVFIRLYCFEKRMLSSSRAETSNEGVLGGPCRPDLLSVIQNDSTDPMIFQNGDEVQMLDTPSSIYPGEMLPSYSDSSGREKIFSDTITTPLSNNSIITMTMRNNHLIVETEERIPCSLWSSADIYDNNFGGMNVFAHTPMSPDIEDYQTRDSDDLDNYSDQQSNHLCTVKTEERRPFYEPTTSRQVDEEDQHVEFFHKNILVFPSDEEKTDIVPSCSYDYNEEQTSSTCGPLNTTGFTQSDLTGSSSSTSRHLQNDYGYGNQCEYVSCEFPIRKRSSSLRLMNCGKEEVVNTAYSSPYFPQTSQEDSVLQLTDCSSSEFSYPSK